MSAKALLAGFALAAMTLRVSAQTYKASVDVKKTAKEQIAYAQQVEGDILTSRTEEERKEKTFRAIAAYHAVFRQWPHEVASVVSASLAEADLWLSMRSGTNAVPVLERLLPLVEKNDIEPNVYHRLGRSYYYAARLKDAESAFDKAERHPATKKQDRVAVRVFRESAWFYEHTLRPKEAARRYRELSDLEVASIESRAWSAIDALRNELDAKDKVKAKDDLRKAEKLVRECRAAGNYNSDEFFERQLAHYRKQVE